uniref:PAP-associated domain-containing protein n=1 Tax=Schistocephalus solidus TaxID=70667 RepID=A0A183S8K7_SCHSO
LFTINAPIFGVEEDLNDFLNEFVKGGSPRFANFITLWQKRQFIHLIYGRQTQLGLADVLCCIFFHLVKHIVAKSTPQLSKICALYLLYAFFGKQPIKKQVRTPKHVYCYCYSTCTGADRRRLAKNREKPTPTVTNLAPNHLHEMPEKLKQNLTGLDLAINVYVEAKKKIYKTLCPETEDQEPSTSTGIPLASDFADEGLLFGLNLVGYPESVKKLELMTENFALRTQSDDTAQPSNVRNTNTEDNGHNRDQSYYQPRRQAEVGTKEEEEEDIGKRRKRLREAKPQKSRRRPHPMNSEPPTTDNTSKAMQSKTSAKEKVENSHPVNPSATHADAEDINLSGSTTLRGLLSYYRNKMETLTMDNEAFQRRLEQIADAVGEQHALRRKLRESEKLVEELKQNLSEMQVCS